ncbi:MAG: hypothetical protein A2V93_00740 [Ignavibacteria bacterium RBG_16_34_14]|nr:MAG: hypothetical protein A2V93_00740 [Ignavibacteria bacterium RBG_16_34_14]
MTEKAKLSLDYFGASDIGMVRVENQDSFGKFPPDNLETYSDKGQLFIVADGVGGHAGGREASSLAVETIRNTYFNSTSNDAAVSLHDAIDAANKAIHQKAKTSEKFGRMGTTSSVLVLKNNIGIIGQVGDSKVFKIEDNIIEQLTMEHTQLNEMLKEGILTEEEAKNYPAKSALSRALGMEDKIKIDIIDNIPLKNGQTFVICTDGLSKVNKDEILNLVTKNSPEDSCAKLINLANERGGKDNVTVQVIKINTDQASSQIPSLKKERIETKRSKKSKWVFIVTIVVILLAISFQFSNSFLTFFNSSAKEEEENIIQQTNDDKNLIENDSDNDPLKQANQLLKKGNYEKALIIYQGVLEKEPMNLGALEGLNNIAAFYLNKADKLKAEKKFGEALEIYLKVQKIQPEDIEIRNSILICENQIKFSDNPDLLNTNNENPGSEEIKYQVNVSSINQQEWSFINIDKSQYEIDGRSIKFYNTSFEKKSLMNFNLNDAVISTDIKIFSKPDGSGAGIILGYNRSEPGNRENFYLLKFNGNDYVLQMVSDNSVEQLLSQPVNDKNSNERNLRVKCSGNLINIYDGMNLINSWKSPGKVFGKVGIYADKNVLVEFQNILISGNK